MIENKRQLLYFQTLFVLRYLSSFKTLPSKSFFENITTAADQFFSCVLKILINEKLLEHKKINKT